MKSSKKRHPLCANALAIFMIILYNIGNRVLPLADTRKEIIYEKNEKAPLAFSFAQRLHAVHGNFERPCCLFPIRR